MSVLDTLNCNEKKAIEELRGRLKKDLLPGLYEDSLMFYRFLKARDFDVDKAEVMLNKHIRWRKVFQVDSVLETLKPKEVFEKYIKPQFIGFGKDGDIIRYYPNGKLEMRDIMKCMKMNDLEKHMIYTMQESSAIIRKENDRTGRKSYQAILIFNLDQLTLANATSKYSAELCLRILHVLQDNYPEVLKAAFVLNAPFYYVYVYSLLKKFMSNAMLQKVHVFGQNGWKEALLKVIDAEVLPAFLGGNRTDPDGNPLCLTFMHHGGKLPEKYHLIDDERWFMDKSVVQKTVVSPLNKNTVAVEVEECGSWIQWEFECKSKDIGFGLFFKNDGHEIEVLPIHRFTTYDGTETGSYKTETVGKYLIIFDNSYSWMNTKAVNYSIKLIKPNS